MDREVKRLKQSRIPIVKVRWNSRRGPEYTWEREDQMQKKYPHLFANPESASQATTLKNGFHNCYDITPLDTYSVQAPSRCVQYVRRFIPELGDPDREIILIGLPKDIYAAVDSCETTQEIWFTSIDGESIESYYHRFSKLMNDFKRNKHFPENIASNLKFLNNLQLEWRRRVTIVHQTKDLHKVDYTQLYDFLKYNQVEVNDLRVERLARAHDPLTFMANSNNPYNYLVFHKDQPSQITYMQQPQPNNNFNA
ncbi:hypothetical protein Tco_0304019 [Tanacetum coccineum]